MKLAQFKNFLNLNRADLTKKISDLIHSSRNELLDMHRDYYDGNHWAFQGNSDRSNMSRSGKMVWGKDNDTGGSVDDVFDRKRSASQVGFHSGQLQVKNYPKLFIQTYQDFIVGTEDSINVVYKSSVEEGEETDPNVEKANEELEILWSDATNYLKTQLVRMVVNTVAISGINYDEKEGYTVTIEDAKEIFPIYDKGKHVGTIKAYFISKEDAKAEYGINGSNNSDQVPYAKIYVKNEEGKIEFYKIVDGIFIKQVGDKLSIDPTPLMLPDPIQFDPFSFVPNIDHAYRNFDETNLEDSEIFSWIEKVDSLNANETIEFITNQFLAAPKVTIDYEMAQKLQIDLDGAAFKEALKLFQFRPGTIDSLPINVVEGKGIPESFYTGKAGIKDSLFEDAGIPQFIVNGSSMSNISVETLQLGMAMLTRKITQKRQQLKRLIKLISIKVLRAKGLIDPELKDDDIIIDVDLPNINTITPEKVLESLSNAVNIGLPEEYALTETLKLLGKAEDVDKVIEMRNENSEELMNEVKKQRSVVQSEMMNQKQAQEDSKTKEQIQAVDKEMQMYKK